LCREDGGNGWCVVYPVGLKMEMEMEMKMEMEMEKNDKRMQSQIYLVVFYYALKNMKTSIYHQ
jgi:hypothetical protein